MKKTGDCLRATGTTRCRGTTSVVSPTFGTPFSPLYPTVAGLIGECFSSGTEPLRYASTRIMASRVHCVSRECRVKQSTHSRRIYLVQPRKDKRNAIIRVGATRVLRRIEASYQNRMFGKKSSENPCQCADFFVIAQLYTFYYILSMSALQQKQRPRA